MSFENYLSFGHYLIVAEALSLSAEDVGIVELSDDEVECRFDYKGQDFEVHMASATIQGVPDVWVVTFEGPRGYGTTGKSGTASSAIYSRMLGCVKQLFDMKKVNGLSFSPAEPGMAVPYDLFYRTYLRPDPPKGKGFMRVSSGLYVSKELIRELGIGDTVLPAHRAERDYLALVKANKARDRLRARIGTDKEIPGDKENLERLEGEMSGLQSRYRKSSAESGQRSAQAQDRTMSRRAQLTSVEDERRAAERAERERLEREERDRQEAEREREREAVRSAERAERARSDAAKRAVASRVAGFAMRRRDAGPLPEQDGMNPSLLSSLGSAPWVAIAPGGEDVLIGKDSVGGSRYMRKSPSIRVSVDPDEALYVVKNFTPVDPGERSRLAKKVYGSMVDARLGREEMESAMGDLPADLAGAVRDMGVLGRAAVSGASAVKRAGRDVASLPGEIKRYYMPGKSPRSEPPEEFSL